MASPTREDAAWLLNYIGRLQIGRYPVKERTHLPTIEDMRCIYLAHKTVGLMANWRKRPEKLKEQHREQERLLKSWLDGCMEDGKINDGIAMVIDERTSPIVLAAAEALVEYDLMDEAEKRWK